MKSFSLIKKKNIFLLSFASLGFGYRLMDTDAYYVLIGLRRGIRSVSTGIKIISNYYINGVSPDTHEYASIQLYHLFKKNSGTYIKLGQSLYQSEHILPEPFIRNLEPLCQEAPKTDITAIKQLLEREFGKKFEDIFEYFEEEPIGSASIAQVHKARLKETHEIVAVKIQHPMIATHCPSDVAITKLATKVGEFLWPGIKLQWIANEFDLNIMNEIDFTNEAKNSEKIKKFFRGDERIIVPSINWNYTTKKILTMSFEEGRSIVDTKYRAENEIKAEEVAHLLTDVFYKQIFKFGFVHADPHPGNLFLRKETVNGRKITRLILLDHGLYRELDKEFVYNYALLWRGVFMQDAEYIKKACVYMNVNKPELFTSIVTNRNYNDVMNNTVKFDTNKRLGKIGQSPEEKEKIKQFISSNLKVLSSTLSEMRSEMILLLKINGYLRSVDCKIGNPINNYNMMIYYVYKELKEDDKIYGDNSSRNKLKMSYEYYFFKSIVMLWGLYFYFSNFWKKEKESDGEEDGIFEAI